MSTDLKVFQMPDAHFYIAHDADEACAHFLSGYGCQDDIDDWRAGHVIAALDDAALAASRVVAVGGADAAEATTLAARVEALVRGGAEFPCRIEDMW